MYRKFWLTNGNDDTFDLTSTSEVFASSPNGLGASQDISIYRTGNVEIITNTNWELDVIKFTLIFPNSSNNALSYQRYEEFVNFCSVAPLVLHRHQPNESSKKRLVSLLSIDKTEIDVEYDTLVCDVDFKCHTLWSDDKVNQVIVQSGRNKGKAYVNKRPYSYSTENLSNVKLINNTNVPTPIKIEIKGRAKDPLYELLQRNVVYGTGRFIGTYDYIQVNADELEEKIVLQQGETYLPNPVRYQDISIANANVINLTFLWLKPGESVLRFLFDNPFAGVVTISWENRYV